MTNTPPPTDFRAGYAALVGRPNAGKSTLLNQILGMKLAITSPKPQTTRNRIAGVHTTDDQQIVLIDTPGLHEAWTALNQAMVRSATSAISDADVVLWVTDLGHHGALLNRKQAVLDADDQAIIALLNRSGRPVIVVVNKVDAHPPVVALPVIEAIRDQLPKMRAAIPISAKTGDGVPTLLAEVRATLPAHPKLYPDDQWTQLSERFLVAEIVREKLFHLTEQEVPYACAVEVLQFDESERESKGLVKILADIIVERPAQKGIVIGKGGAMLKKVGTQARTDIEAMLGCKCYLELFVKVERDWSKTANGLHRVGFEA